MKNLLVNWTVMRRIRMGLGIIILIQAILQKDAISGIFAGILMVTAFANVGCCSASTGCEIDNRKKQTGSDN